MFYRDFLKLLHERLQPQAYLEIGIDKGDTLVLSHARTIGVDPAPSIELELLSGKPWLKLYTQPSDEFFLEHTAEATLEGARLDLVFIDGFHEFSQVIRDLENVERWGHPETVVVIHDVLPENVRQASHSFQEGGWTGDVWRVVPFLDANRPDLDCHLVDVRHSGALVVTGLDPSHSGMAERAAAEEMNFLPDGPAYEQLVKAWLQLATPVSPGHVLRALGFALSGEEAAASTRIDTRIDRGMRILAESSWRPVFQRSIDAFYEQQWDEGIAACLTLLNEPALPAHIRDLTFRNQTYYARPLAELCPGAHWQSLLMASDEGSLPQDPSPAAAGDHLTILLRGDAARAISAITAVVPGDDLCSAPEVITLPTRDSNGSTMTDMQPFFWHGELHAAALLSTSGDEGSPRAGLLRLTAEGSFEIAALGPRAGHFRHGWSPFISADSPHFVAWWEPTEVFRFDQDTGEFARVALRMAPHLAERFQGGSPGVVIPGGFLFLVNEMATFDDGNAVTLSRFVRIDDGFQIDAVSPQFFVTSRGQEIATGLARLDDRLIA